MIYKIGDTLINTKSITRMYLKDAVQHTKSIGCGMSFIVYDYQPVVICFSDGCIEINEKHYEEALKLYNWFEKKAKNDL